jgi:hypothetical protein
MAREVNKHDLYQHAGGQWGSWTGVSRDRRGVWLQFRESFGTGNYWWHENDIVASVRAQ